MTTRSVWDDLTDQAKEAIREVDKQLAAADALAVVLKNVRLTLFYARDVAAERGAAYQVEAIESEIQEVDKALREYREVSGG